MSKISLEPNASGAGTFTLAAPNSNTNRTLNLPDEAGKLLSTGNDDPAEVFKQSNILGTVSESGGVPTGAIIERDSNANGEYVKYADGTMICTGIISGSLSGIVSTNLIGNFTFPASFVTSPAFSTKLKIGTGDGPFASQFVVGSMRNNDVSSTGLQNVRIARHADYASAAGDQNTFVLVIAIGRWY